MTEPVEAPPQQPVAGPAETTQPVAPAVSTQSTQPLPPAPPNGRTPVAADQTTQPVQRPASPQPPPPRLADGVGMLVEEKLRPLGILAAADGSQPRIQKQDPFLGLKLKTALIPAGVVRAITALFRPLFWPPVILAVLAGLVAFDLWFFLDHGVAQSMRQLLYQPLYLILTFGFIVVSAAFHETGHATGCRYGGAKPGVMGAGIYIVWPAFYTDVTASYRLGRGGRLRTDLGGVYFNAIFILAVGGAYFATGFEPLLIPVFLAHLEIFRQLLPLVRLDGYHVLADLTGVPDLFARIKPILVSLVPWKRGDKRVTELKPWVRVVVTLWVLIFIPFLALNIAYIVVFAPRIFATGWDSFTQHLGQTSEAFGSGDGAAGAAGVLRLVALALPAIGIVFGFGRGGIRLLGKLGGVTKRRPFTGMLGFVVLGAALVGLVALWWPDSDYTPIREGERFTVTEATTAISRTASGTPAFEPAAGGEAAPRTGSQDDAEAQSGETVVDQTPSRVTSSPSPLVSDDPTTDTEDEVIAPTTDPSPEPTIADASPEPTTVEPTSEPSPESSPVTP